MVDAILSYSRMHSCNLQHLNLRMNGIGSAGGIKLAELIAHSPHLRILELSSGCACEAAADALFKSIQLRSHTLEELDILDSALGPRVLTLLDALRAFTALKVLRTSPDYKGDLGGHALAQFLMFSGGSRLTKLHITYSNITETGALELARALAKAYTLRSITASKNPFGPCGTAAIVDALVTASANPMDAIDFGGCEIGDDGASAVGRLINRRGCRNVYLYLNGIKATGAKAIMDSAAASTCVTNSMNLQYNPIGDEGVKYILDKVIQSRRIFIHRLDIADTEMGVKGAMAVKLAVETYGVPCSIRVSNPSGDAEAGRILKGVKKWERDSKPSRAPILQIHEYFFSP